MTKDRIAALRYEIKNFDDNDIIDEEAVVSLATAELRELLTAAELVDDANQLSTLTTTQGLVLAAHVREIDAVADKLALWRQWAVAAAEVAGWPEGTDTAEVRRELDAFLDQHAPADKRDAWRRLIGGRR